MDRLRVVVSDDPDSEDLVVEIWLDDALLCSISGKHPDLAMTFYSYKGNIKCSLASFQSVLLHAIRRATQLTQENVITESLNRPTPPTPDTPPGDAEP